MELETCRPASGRMPYVCKVATNDGKDRCHNTLLAFLAFATMGTRGLYSYRYRRRYHTTYHHMDSYLDGLGAMMVGKVPTDPTEFKQWVEKSKNKLEKEYRDWKAELKGIKDNKDGSSNRLPECPFSMRAPTLDLYIEYTYVIDLDRNVFTVNEVVHLPLDAIPRGANDEDWIGAVANKAHTARILHLSPTVSPPDARHLALYDESGATQSLELPSHEEPFAFPTCGVIMDYFFRQFRFAYSPVLDDIEMYEPNHPDFLAMVQGILTLAAWGQFCMSAREFEPSYQNNVTTVAPEWSDLELDDAETHFWHLSTLIVLEIGLDDEQRLRSAVGKAVGLWRASSKPSKNPTVFIISLKSVVMVHVSDKTVSHSAPVELLGAVTASQPPFLTFSHTPGFDLLKRHFTPTLPTALNADRDSQLALTIDVLESIFDMSDYATLRNLTYTCKAFRTLCLVRPRFRIGEYRLLYHVGDNEFTALDDFGVTRPVVVGKFGRAVETWDLPGGFGFELVLNLRTEDADQVCLEIMGVRCLSKAQGDGDSIVLVEKPKTDWRLKSMSRME